MKVPPPFLLAALALAASLPGLAVGQNNGFVCDIPTNGCTNGMFNQALCECHCIPPFCADRNGDCTIQDDCGEVKWKDCTRGVNCPWYVNVLRAESCTTGPNVSSRWGVRPDVLNLLLQPVRWRDFQKNLRKIHISKARHALYHTMKVFFLSRCGTLQRSLACLA